MVFNDEQVREIAGQAAGLGAGAVMRLAPDVVMPSEEITAGLEALFAEHGVDVSPPNPDQTRLPDGPGPHA